MVCIQIGGLLPGLELTLESIDNGGVVLDDEIELFLHILQLSLLDIVFGKQLGIILFQLLVMLFVGNIRGHPLDFRQQLAGPLNFLA